MSRSSRHAPLQPVRVVFLSAITGLLMASFGTLAQTDPIEAAMDASMIQAQPGLPGTPDELRALGYAQQEKHIRAREYADRVLEQNPSSFAGHEVLALVYHYAEGNFPRALYHANQAEALLMAQHGDPPQAAWRWHAILLKELAGIHNELSHFEETLAYFERYNQSYNPRVVAERAWPLMKMRQFDAARRAAAEGIQEGSQRQREVALNALCAIEFEAGNTETSYEACREAVNYARTTGNLNSVDLTNFAEASRSVMQLEEAERTLLEATRARGSWFGNPWLELAELYTRGGRFSEALDALRELPGVRRARPPHVRDSDRNETWRALSAFYLVAGRPDEAQRITSKAMVMPDRRAHNSRDPAQDRTIIALLDRRSHRMLAESELESAAGAGLWDRTEARVRALSLRFDGWMSGRQSVQLLSTDEALVGAFQVGSARAAVMPTWLAPELSGVLGPGVVESAIASARTEDQRSVAGAYYDAFAAEAAFVRGDEERALELAERSLPLLSRGEALLRARLLAIRAEATATESGTAAASPLYAQAMLSDPGVLRRMELELPVRIVLSQGGDVAEAIEDAIGRSPRFDEDDAGLTLNIDARANHAELCLRHEGTTFGCTEASAETNESPAEFAARASAEFHRDAFAPRVDLSQGDIGSLDGSNRVTRDPLEDMLGPQ